MKRGAGAWPWASSGVRMGDRGSREGIAERGDPWKRHKPRSPSPPGCPRPGSGAWGARGAARLGWAHALCLALQGQRDQTRPCAPGRVQHPVRVPAGAQHIPARAPSCTALCGKVPGEQHLALGLTGRAWPWASGHLCCALACSHGRPGCSALGPSETGTAGLGWSWDGAERPSRAWAGLCLPAPRPRVHELPAAPLR